MSFLAVLFLLLAGVGATALVVYLVVLVMVRKNFFITEVEQGWQKVVLRRGKYFRTLDPGWQWVGIPGIYTLYKRTMTFMKGITSKDGKPQAEPHQDKDISSFKTTDYPYAFPFKDEEDNKGVPLIGMLAAVGVIRDYEKAFFRASDWYSMVNTKIMPEFVAELARVSYDDDLVGRDTDAEKKKKAFSDRLWARLNRKKRRGRPSVVEELLNCYGFELKSIELRSVDPSDPNWRPISLAPYRAEREKAAAVHQAQTSAILLDDTNQSLMAWRAENPNATPEQVAIKQEELASRVKLKSPGFQELHIKGLEGATTAVVGGGGSAGILVGQGGGGGKKRDKKRKRPQETTSEEGMDELFD